MEKIICVFTPRSVLTTALSSTGESIHLSYCRQESGTEWDETFYDKALSKELILRKNQNAKRFAFAWSDKQLLIPDGIYKSEAAGQLLSDVHHVAADEFAMIYNCRPDKAHLVAAFNLAAETLAQKFLNITTLNPVNIFQFLNSDKGRGFRIDIMVAENTFFGTMRKDGKLLWHQAVAYHASLDIVYHLAHLCKEWNADIRQVNVNYCSLMPESGDVLTMITRFFPDVEYAQYPDEDSHWWPVFHLAQQISACVS